LVRECDESIPWIEKCRLPVAASLYVDRMVSGRADTSAAGGNNFDKLMRLDLPCRLDPSKNGTSGIVVERPYLIPAVAVV